MINIAIIPIDNRPVCYDLIYDTLSIDKNINVLLPPIELLGDLKNIAKVDKIFAWLNNIKKIDAVIVSLDTIAYGGLVSSRRVNDDFLIIKSRIDKFIQIVKRHNAKIYAFSSIMRISNNNINEEEKIYWDKYGKLIFKYSQTIHKLTIDNKPILRKKLFYLKKQIPNDILKDYLKTRIRNFKINQYYLNLQKNDIFKTLIFSLDDCNQYGLNIFEASKLREKSNSYKEIYIKTGADEIPFILISKAYNDIINKKKKLKIAIKYANDNSIDKISKYEDRSVLKSISDAIVLSGCEIAKKNENFDLILFVNNFTNEQGELVMDIYEPSSKFIIPLEKINKPFFVVDILNANGADFDFVKNNKIIFSSNNFLGYSAWNTTSNSLGSALACAIIMYLADNKNISIFKKIQATRLLDDWIYQSYLRQKLRFDDKNLNNELLSKHMEKYHTIIEQMLNYKLEHVYYSYPWKRFFEIRIKIGLK